MQEIQATVRVGCLLAVAANREHMHHIFQNLLGNAMKYRSDRPLEISVESTCDKGVCMFAVQDNGIGIHPDDHNPDLRDVPPRS